MKGKMYKNGISKKCFALLISILMVVAMLPSIALAEGTGAVATNVAKVGDKSYTTLAEAISEAQSGDTITLIDDVTIDPEVYNVKNRLNVNEDNITIDLNGKTLTAPNCTLTLCGDGIILKNGKMVATTTATNQTYGSYVAQIKGKNVIVNGVTTTGGFNVAGYNTDNPDTPDTTVTITNCDITATNFYTVCSQRNSEATIKNSTLTFGNAAYFWLEKKEYKEGDDDPANVDAKLFYEKDTVTFKDPSKTLYNAVGVAPIAFYTVTVDPFNGDDATIKTVNDRDTLLLNTLGDPTRDGYTFTGWYNDNTKLTEDITPTGNMDIVAHWEKNKSSKDVDTNTETKTETNKEDGSTTTTTTETVKETAKDGSTTETVTKDVVKTNTDGTKEKVNTATETKTDKSGAVTETKSKTVTKTDATGKVTETVETKADTKTTTENNKTTEAKTETVTTKDADGNVTETVKTEATVEQTKTLTTIEQIVTTTDKDGVAVVETTKTVEDKTNNVAIETKLSNNTAKTEAKIAQAEETLPTTMTVDATATKAKADEATAEVTKTEVTLSAETVAAIKEAAAAIDYKKVETVELKTDVATLEIDNTALKTLTKDADSQSLLLKVAKTDSTVEETKNATATFELTAALVDGEGHEIKVFNDTDAATNGTIKVNVAYEPEKADNTIEVYYVAEDGTKTKMDASYKDGILSWDTNHFSTYEVVEIAKAEPTPDPDDNNDNKNSQISDSTPATGDDFNIMPLIALILISSGAVTGIAFTSRKKT